MPWIDKEDGTREYKVSIYAKEELPTWDEVFNVWFNENIHYYHPKNPKHQDLDPYWKIPRRKYMIMIICNQFNKMLFEDGYYQPLIDYLNSNDEFIKNIGGKISDIRFVCENLSYLKNPEDAPSAVKMLDEEFMKFINKEQNDYFNKHKFGTSEAPSIYTIPLPTGEKNPFITDYPRISSDELTGMISVIPVMKVDTGNGSSFFPWILDIGTADQIGEKTFTKNWTTIVMFLIKGIALYFKDPVGWKDENGNIISNGDPIKRGCEGSGTDAAL